MLSIVSTGLINIFSVLVCAILFAIIYQCVIKYWSYFSQNGVKFIRGAPIFGTHYKMMIGTEPLTTSFRKCYEKFPNERFIGVYDMTGTPAYLVRDPHIIKQITIKDFDHFTNHQFAVSEKTDSLLSRSLFIMRDQQWKEARSEIITCFTLGNLKLMFDLSLELVHNFCDHLTSEMQYNDQIFSMRDLFTRYVSDSIATCSFGYKIDSLKDKNNNFYKAGKSISNFDRRQGIKFLGYASRPKFMDSLKINFFYPRDSKYFRKFVKDIIKYRQNNNIIRHDMINLFLESNNTLKENGDVKYINNDSESNIGNSNRNNKKWEEDDLVSKCMMFLMAGFNALSSAMCFLAHELTVNQDIQNRLYNEIVAVQEELKGKTITYDILQNMKYLDMVLSETLRRWSINPAVDRYVNKPFVLEHKSGEKVQLNVGDSIWIPTYGIHMDPKYHPNPEKFDPERFNDDNKNKIHDCTYFPFGLGPRNCIGSKFALMECKAMFYHILSVFHLEKCAKTQDPIKLKVRAFNMDARNGFWIKFRLRDKCNMQN